MEPARRAATIAAIATIAVVPTACDDDGSAATDAGAAGSTVASTDDGTGTDGSTVAANGEQRFPDIVAVEAVPVDDGTWTFAVTVSSPYDTPERYADGWRVLGPDGEVYGVHTLAHDHADEQPFTRRQTGVEIPADVDEVTIEGRDRRHGFGGDTLTIELGR